MDYNQFSQLSPSGQKATLDNLSLDNNEVLNAILSILKRYETKLDTHDDKPKPTVTVQTRVPRKKTLEDKGSSEERDSKPVGVKNGKGRVSRKPTNKK